MRIRPIARADLPAIRDIAYDAFRTDELFHWLFPGMHKYPDDLRRFQLLRIRRRIVEKGNQGWVVETEETDSEWIGEPEIMGFAFWVRSGKDGASKKWSEDSLFNSMCQSN